MSDGIKDTADSADAIAAVLQTTSSLIACVESAVMQTIDGLLVSAVQLWFGAQLAAVETFGASEAAAAEEIASESSRAASRVGRLIASLTTPLKRIFKLMRQVRAKLSKINEKSFAELLRSPMKELKKIKNKSFMRLVKSSPGKKLLDSPRAGTRDKVTKLRKEITQDYTTRRHARIRTVDIAKSEGREVWNVGKKSLLFEAGLSRSNKTANNETRPGGYQIGVRTFPFSDGKDPEGNDKIRNVPNYGGLFKAVTYVAPGYRAWQYDRRAGEVPSSGAIDQKLDLWGAPLPATGG